MLTWCGKETLGQRLHHSASHIIGIGLRGVSPHDNKCWLYYPEDNCPFYRCTVFSHYAKKNVPGDNVLLPTLRLGDGSVPLGAQEPREGPYWSLMLEVSESAIHKAVDINTVIEVLASVLLSNTDSFGRTRSRALSIPR